MDVTGKQSNSLSGEYKKEVPMRELLLGVDIGTSACKVAVFNKQGEVIASGNGDYQVYYPHPGWAEQNPDEWWSDRVGRLFQLIKMGMY